MELLPKTNIAHKWSENLSGCLNQTKWQSGLLHDIKVSLTTVQGNFVSLTSQQTDHVKAKIITAVAKKRLI